jgi:hypothetical protein
MNGLEKTCGDCIIDIEFGKGDCGGPDWVGEYPGRVD